MSRGAAAPLGSAPVTVIYGHAGVGKTTLVLNLALREAAAGRHVTVADMDLVNPYFRSSDYRDLLERSGVEVVSPTFAGTTLDTPSLSGRLEAEIERFAGGGSPSGGQASGAGQPAGLLLIDVGGDDVGATGIGRYSRRLAAAGAHAYYAVNAFRALTPTPADAAALLPGIERNARLEACGVVNTSNLMGLTVADDVERGRQFALGCAGLLGLELVATCVPRTLMPEVERRLAGQAHEQLVAVDKLVTTPWDRA